MKMSLEDHRFISLKGVLVQNKKVKDETKIIHYFEYTSVLFNPYAHWNAEHSEKRSETSKHVQSSEFASTLESGRTSQK